MRDYQAIAAPWSFDLEQIGAPVSIWAPSDDEIVPVRAAALLGDSLVDSRIAEVTGAHDWLLQNWSAVLEHCV